MGTVTVDAGRPRLRGLIHRYGATAAAGAYVTLGVLAPDAAAVVWIAIYGVSVTAMLAVSAAYHSGRLNARAQRWFKRLDHSTILLAIAGSYTGVFGLALHGTPRTVILVVVWSAAVFGVAVRMLWLDAPYPLVAAVYLVVGWVAVLEVNPVLAALSGPETALVLAGGLLYTAGGIVYALHRPDPWPRTYGYHEVFHTLVVIAVVCHFAAAASIVRARG